MLVRAGGVGGGRYCLSGRRGAQFDDSYDGTELFLEVSYLLYHQPAFSHDALPHTTLTVASAI